MIGNTVWDYLFIRSCIFFLHWIAPFSILYCISIPLVSPFSFHLPWLLEAWFAFEAAFYFLVYLPRKFYLQTAATHPTPAYREIRRLLFQRCNETIPDPEQYLQKWFLDAPVSEIKRENVKEFFRWAFLNTGEPNPADDEELENYVEGLEKLLGRKLVDGRGNAKCLRLTLDKVEMFHRSLTWYLVSFLGGAEADSTVH
jgi:hypothetical protein